MRCLATELGVPAHTIDLAIYDHPRHTDEAGLQVLQAFRRTVGTKKEAFRLLWEALMRSGMDPVAWEVLGKERH